MKLSLHGVSVWYSNAVTQLRIAREAGFTGLELLPEHIFRYLENGGSYAEYRQLMQDNGIDITCINALKRIGRYQPQARAELIQEARMICHAAAELACPVVQIMALDEINELTETSRNTILHDNICAIADIGKPLGIRFQIEVVAFTPFNSLQQGLDIIAACGRDNVGLVIDFWHLHAGGKTHPDEVAKMDPSLIYGVHFCDGRAARKDEAWDEWILRDYAPGQGEVNIDSWVRALRTTGYNGVWSPEWLSPHAWEHDVFEAGKLSMQSLKHYGISD